MNSISFFRAAIKDYKVGAITKTSRFVIGKILSYVKPEYKYFVEYGPGDGVVTKELLKRIPHDGKLVAIELNEEFFRELQKIKDPRFTVLKGDIAEISGNLKTLGLPRIDFVLSSVPFTIIGPKTRKEIVQNTHDAMAKGGTLLMFQYSLLLKPIIRKIFSNFSFYLEVRNFPPYFIMTALKK